MATSGIEPVNLHPDVAVQAMTMNIDLILKYFPNLTDEQKERFAALDGLYREWNAQINVISRQDIDALYEKHC